MTRRITPVLLVVALAVVSAAPPAAGQGQASGQAQNGSATSRHALFPPDSLSVLEAPDRDIWQKPDQIMDALGIADGSKVADIGAGGGYFTVRLSRRVGPNGIVWAEDVQPAMLEAIARRVAKDVKDIRNVRTVQGTNSDPKLTAGSLDAALILETFSEVKRNGNVVVFLQNVRAALRDGGRLGIIEYRASGGGPGPNDERPSEDSVKNAALEAGFKFVKRETFLPFQFFLVFTK